jgi:hypothetical protein
MSNWAVEARSITIGFDTDRRRISAVEDASFAVERNSGAI